MIATHTIKKDGILYKAGSEIPDEIKTYGTELAFKPVPDNEVVKKVRNRKKRTVNED